MGEIYSKPKKRPTSLSRTSVSSRTPSHSSCQNSMRHMDGAPLFLWESWNQWNIMENDGEMAMYSSRNCELPKGIKFDVETKNYLYHMLRIERATHLPERGHVSPHKGRNPHWFIFWALYSTMSKTHIKAYKSVNMAQNHWIEFFSCKTKRKVNKQLGQTYWNYKKLRHISVQPLQFFWNIFRISFMYDVYTYMYIYINMPYQYDI